MTIEFSIHSVINSFAIGGHLISGGLTAFAINQLAHELFDVKKNSMASKAIKSVAFLAGAGLSIYFAPQTSIYAMTANGAFISTTIIIASLFTIGSEVDGWNGKKLNPFGIIALLSLSIPIVGLFGRVALISAGTVAAGCGAST